VIGRIQRSGTLAATLWVASLSHALGASVPLEPERWVVHAEQHAFEEHLGRPSLFLQDGIAWVKDSELLNGVIEFDIAFSGERGFDGVAWRLQDEGNYEEFYVRPHQSGNPDACQYTPAFFGLTSWQLYHGPGYSVAIDYRNDAWNHVKVVISGKQAEVYVNDDEHPALFIGDQKRAVEAGRVGLNSFFAPAYFSEFRYEPMEAPALKGNPPPPPVAPDGAIMEWSVSDLFDGSALAEGTELTEGQTAGRAWTRLQSEPSGLANLAQVQPREQGKDTVFTRVTIRSPREQSRKMKLGFSDRAKVYLNGALIYSGDNTYRSRDYRYLGTIGWFDEVILPLRQGENRLWIAVAEQFGGWGIQAAIADSSELTIKP